MGPPAADRFVDASGVVSRLRSVPVPRALGSSATVSTLTRLTDRQVLWPIVRSSVPGRIADAGVVRMRRAIATATTTGMAGAAVELSRDAVCASDTRYAVKNWRHIATRSFLYRWLTAEPEPEVIEIDLRETYSAGPMLAAIDRLLGSLIPHSRYSTLSAVFRHLGQILQAAPVRVAGVVLATVGVGALGLSILTGPRSTLAVAPWLALVVIGVALTRVRWSLDELRGTRGWQALAAAFEPPEPPEAWDERER